MKKLAIAALPLLLTACISSEYTTDVTSESYREDFLMQQPVVSETGTAPEVMEDNVQVNVMQKPMEEKPVVKMAPQNKKSVAITPPTAKQKASYARYGYTIQVVAVGSQAKVDRFAKQLPSDGQPIWENYKVVNGTKWFSVLYGDFATRADAKKAISKLPAELLELKPFVKSIDKIKNSEYPTLNKLN